MTSKALIAIFGMLLAAPAATPTQEAAGTAQAQERLQKLKERLRLTPQQVEQVRPVFQEEFEKLRAVRDKYSGERSRRGRMRMARELRDVQQAADEKLRGILSKTQMDELKKIREETRQQFRERGGRR
ncbi:MAG: hypothetical protein IT158_21625 [Bryobacterales bacterium]|nr:hypothetical protein [Bryobacterales bacterium]